MSSSGDAEQVVQVHNDGQGGGVEEEKSDDSSTSSNVNLQPTLDKVQARVNALLGKHLADEELPEWGTKLLELLASLTRSVNAQNSDASIGGSESEKLSYAEILTRTKTVTLSQTDVKHLPRLAGSAEIGSVSDVDVQSVLNQFRTDSRSSKSII